MIKFATAAAVAALTAATMAATTPSATAAEATPAVSHVHGEAGLRLTGYDAAVAEAHGYVIKTTADGMQYTVRKNATPAEDVTAQAKAVALWGKSVKPAPGVAAQPASHDEWNDVCGKAWLDGDAVGGRAIKVSSGFNLLPGQAAVFYYWHVHAVDGGGVSNHAWGPSGLWDRQEWHGTWAPGGLTMGSAYTRLDSDTSYATLDDGSVCHPATLTVYYTIY
ncbi:hypothetical protein ACFZDG_26840 [Kitasatospora xanthocidica]|uniref:hypothetical protein n=1 Tax=Kitasatospora xanthocidica TaxID=83382 RepID=UPI0036E19ABF